MSLTRANTVSITPVARNTTQAPVGSAWNDGTTYPTYPTTTNYQPTGSAAGVPSLGGARQLTQNYTNPVALRQELVMVLNEGASVDLASAVHVRKLDGYLAQMQPGQMESLKSLLNAASTRVEQVMILKAFAANESWQNLVQFAAEMRGQSEAEIVRRTTMRDDNDLAQQWQDACGPTMLQAAAGEVDPRFAWELNKSWNIAAIDPLGQNAAVAAQQKQWLEMFGGRAVQRGQQGGTGIAIGQMLNQMMTPITGARYDATEVNGNTAGGLELLAQRLSMGYDVPLRISWDRPQPAGVADSGHFVLAMAVRGAQGNREFQIHDPWTGKSAWVNERALLGNTMPPMFPNYARLTHVYTPTPVA